MASTTTTPASSTWRATGCGLSLQILPPGELPTTQPKPFFAFLDRTLSSEISRQVKRPFWIDTVGQSRHVEIRIKHDTAILRFLASGAARPTPPTRISS